ncbi:hypothetical protein [Saccharopolyspora sp. ASAGF58]|uniref:YunG family protein n=1 Tax=Saccharopolyspora sp. ASAGF58 TaxID=2719023 RepID=UPI001FF0907C|nr:hypothetical protein [Saccharopolyspora sp. ASAGF58]
MRTVGGLPQAAPHDPLVPDRRGARDPSFLGSDTCAPEDIPAWHPGNPARGQCGTTALVLNDLFGGDLMRGDVHRGSEWVDYHWWNRLGGGVELDLTRGQFASNELVGPGGGEPVSRPDGKTRLDTEYETFRKRVLTYLECQPTQ